MQTNKTLMSFALILFASCFLHSISCAKKKKTTTHKKQHTKHPMNWKNKKAGFWKKRLTPLQYKVCRKGGTEWAFTGKLLKNKKAGTYFCSSCGHHLFDSKHKFRSGTGWPSFTAPAKKQSVTLKVDNSHGMLRTEVVCARCNAHLGHVFNDGPKPSGKRYCINSVCLRFNPSK